MLVSSSAAAQFAPQVWPVAQDGGQNPLFNASYVNAGYFLADSANAPCPGYAFTNKPCVGMGDDAFGELFWYTDTNAGTPSMALRSDVGLNLLYAGSGKNGVIVWPTVGAHYPALYASAQAGFGALQVDDQAGGPSMFILSTGGGSDLMEFFFTGGAGSAAEWSAPHQIIINPTTNLQVPYLGGSGTRCVQVDNSGNVAIASGACGSGTGTVTSVAGTAGRIVVTPSSPNPVVDLATFGTASTCAWANVVTDAWGRTACTANTAPQPAGNYITALTHDVTAAGPGSVTANVVGIEDDAICRGDLLFANESAPSTPSAGDTRVYVDATSKNICAKDDGGNINHGIRTTTCGTHTFAMQVADNGVTGCAQVQFSDLGGSLACSQLPALTGPDVVSSAGSCGNKVKGVTDGANVDWPVTGTFANNQAMITSGGNWTTTNECNVFASCAAGGSLSGTYPNPSVAFSGVTGSVSCSQLPAFTGGATSTAGACALTLDPNSVASATTKRDYTLNMSLSSFAGTDWLLAGNGVEVAITQVVEYPNIFVAGHVRISAAILTNTITAGTLTYLATLNGAAIGGGSSGSFTSATTPGVYTTGAVATGSTTTQDTIGLAIQAPAGYLGGFQIISFQVTLTP